MKTKFFYAAWIISFKLLNLYVNLIPRLLPPDQVQLWAAYWLGFFVLAFLLARFALGLKGIRDFGLRFHRRWLLNLGLGLLIGTGVYALKYGLFYGFGKFAVTGLMPGSYILNLLLLALLAMFFSSLLNDIMIRGYSLAFFRKTGGMRWYVPAATLLYVLDDLWNEGPTLINILFSALLGLAFAWTVYKTGSIWMSFGLHWGGNLVYRLMYGFDGQGIWKLEKAVDSSAFDYLSLLLTAGMVWLVYWVLKKGDWKADERRDVEGILAGNR